MKIFGKINLKNYMSLSVLNYIHVPLFNIDMSLFCIDMNIEAHFYRYIDISDINDSSSRRRCECLLPALTAVGKHLERE